MPLSRTTRRWQSPEVSTGKFGAFWNYYLREMETDRDLAREPGPDRYSRRYVYDLQTAVPRVGSIQADRPTGRDVEVCDPDLDVLGWAQVTGQMHMALAFIDERLASQINARGTRWIFRGKKGKRTGFDHSDRRARVAVPAGAAARPDYDLLHEGRLGDLFKAAGVPRPQRA